MDEIKKKIEFEIAIISRLIAICNDELAVRPDDSFRHGLKTAYEISLEQYRNLLAFAKSRKGSENAHSN